MLYDDVIFLTVDSVHDMHVECLKADGGSDGVRDAGMISSAIGNATNYGTIAEVAAAYVFGIAKNHGFIDGNKRTAAAALFTFLNANGYEVDLPAQWADYIEQIADSRMGRAALVPHIVALMGGVDVDIE